ncbi:HNH endonuclease signature motif containing protein [Stutzerimonas stutzeri]|uniref:HNH nuclease domain-containing protein n=1 Tax=Stutzerimonas stutzeri KOS6 TaxID=1218352 RepID=A0A061JJV4_STUST|nr:HNH endonuclease signature motif containing protein [Stutzerimonas stutzeri]EWC39606.1 hypothetical protein B597_019640 [Stutzerimonas stutzeri KOS6]
MTCASPLAGRRRTEYRHWTPAEDATLAELYATKPITEIAALMGRGTGSIHNRVSKLGLTRPDEFKEITGCGRFKPGHQAWNAGRKGWQAGGRAKDTQFKLGHRPSNTWRPIGAERTDKGGILYRKVADTGDKKADWKAAHVLVWEEHNGPVPEGRIVIFLDRDRQNFDPENLIAVTRAYNMRRNSIDRYPPEYLSAARSLDWFKRKLNKLEQHHEQPQ